MWDLEGTPSVVGGGYVVVDLGGGRKGLAEMTPDTTSESLRAAINESLANGGPVSKAVSREFVNGRFVALGDETDPLTRTLPVVDADPQQRDFPQLLNADEYLDESLRQRRCPIDR